MVGSLRYSYAYGLFPIAWWSALRYVIDRSPQHLYIHSLLLIVLFYFQPHIAVIYILSLATTGVVWWHAHKEYMVRLGKMMFISGLFLGISLLPVWLPHLLYKTTSLIPENYFFTQGALKSGIGITVSSAMALTIRPIDSYWTMSSLSQATSILLGCIWVVVLLRKRSRLNLALSVCLLVSIFLAKGSLPPFSEFSAWIYTHIPVFHAFRDPSKFISLSSFAISLLIPSLVPSLSIRRKTIVSLILLCGWVSLYGKSFYSGNFSGSLVPFDVPSDYEHVAKEISGRLLYIAPKQHLQGLQDYVWYPPTTLNASVLTTPFDVIVRLPQGTLAKAGQIGQSYSSRTMSYVEPLCTDSYFPILAQKFGIDWMFFDRSLQPGLSASPGQCHSPPAFPEYRSYSIGALYRFPIPYDPPISTATHATFILGNLSAWRILGNSYTEFLQQPSIFINQLEPATLSTVRSVPGPVFLHNSTQLDGIMAFATNKTAVDFSPVLDNIPNGQKHWIWDKGIVDAQTMNLGEIVFSQSPIYTTSKVSQTFIYELPRPDEYIAFLRMKTAPGSGGIMVDSSGNTFSGSTAAPYSGLIWKPIFDSPFPEGKHSLTISTDGTGPVLIDSIVFLSRSEFEAARDRYADFLEGRTIFTHYSPEFLTTVFDLNHFLSEARNGSDSFLPTTSISRIDRSPTHITFTVSSAPTLVQFKESYSPWWRLANQTPLIVDGYSNGFLIQNPGTYTISYVPQMAYTLCLIAALTEVMTLTYLAFRATTNTPPERNLKGT